jgi:hypothetical protein
LIKIKLKIVFKLPEEKIEDLVRSKSNKFRPFIPDFSLRVSEDVQILRISRVQWLAAVRATYFEKKQTANGGTPMLNSDGEEIDLLTQELEKVGHADPSNIITSELIHERTSSLALTIESDIGVENEKLLAQHQALNNLSNSSKIASDSPMNSERTSPTLTKKHRHQLFRSATATATTTPLLTNESLSSKNLSMV